MAARSDKPDKKADKESALRRVPTQERSRRRFEAILDAAAAIFADVGFDAATTEGIAAAAETSIGSLYQFFPSKEAIFTALAQRCLGRSRVLVEAMLSSWPAERPWTDLVDVAVDGLWAHHRQDLGLQAIMRNLHLYGTFASADQALMQEFIAGVREILRRYAPTLTRPRATILATVVVHMIEAMLFKCEREEPALGLKLVVELKTLVRRYLEPELTPAVL